MKNYEILDYETGDEDENAGENSKKQSEYEESVDDYENRNQNLQKYPCNEEDNICDHLCFYVYYDQENEPRMECQCYPGHVLDESNGHSCIEIESNGKVF